ncbi:hypothetical protein CASFOL_013555 [Castilleja foliolosa]|uniref:Aluminum-activated malate transporter n=1 Tax=Castilleja foliolosa TaxID=1961234 RepID=A0ABD3DKC8_9LAMI
MSSLIDLGRKPGSFLAYIRDLAKAKVVETTNMIKKLAKDDPRRVVHSMKVGLALTLVSVLYYFRPTYDFFGEARLWAILTVVADFDFTAGGTLSKSLNRGCATMVASALGYGAAYVSVLGGVKAGQLAIIGFLIFILATTATFIRFIPKVKKKYDYGVMVFILSFSLGVVTGHWTTDILKLARQRLSIAIVGGTTCVVISTLICPVWSGQDLHNLVSGNIEKLADFLQGFGKEFASFGQEGGKFTYTESDDTSPFLGFKKVLGSKALAESLASSSSWEPPHGGFRYGYPWKQYLKIGVLNRECATQIEVLERFILNSKPDQVSIYPEFHLKFQKPCSTMSIESSKALKELSNATRNMRFPSSAVETHIRNSKVAAEELEANIITLGNLSLPEHNLQETMQLFLVASALIDIIKCIEKISISVNELAKKAHFKKSNSTHEENSNPLGDINGKKGCTIVPVSGA